MNRSYRSSKACQRLTRTQGAVFYQEREAALVSVGMYSPVESNRFLLERSPQRIASGQLNERSAVSLNASLKILTKKKIRIGNGTYSDLTRS